MSIRSILNAFLLTGCLFGLWLLYVTKMSLQECLLDLAFAIVSTAGLVAWARSAKLHFRATRPMLLSGWRMAGYAFSGTWELVQALARECFSPAGADDHLAAVGYESCQESPRAAARRAAAITYTTCTPNFVVLDVIREQKLLVFHQVLKGEVRRMTRELGAREA